MSRHVRAHLGETGSTFSPHSAILSSLGCREEEVVRDRADTTGTQVWRAGCLSSQHLPASHSVRLARRLFCFCRFFFTLTLTITDDRPPIGIGLAGTGHWLGARLEGREYDSAAALPQRSRERTFDSLARRH